MKNQITSVLLGLFMCLTCFSQGNNIPYNPDGNGDSFIGVSDLQDLLANYGLDFIPIEMMLDSAFLVSQIDLIDSLLSANQLPPGDSLNPYLSWNGETWAPSSFLAVGNSNTSGGRVGFDQNTVWHCPEGVYSVDIELWGAGGLSGNSVYCNGYCNNMIGYWRSGGPGGNGGYLKTTIPVVPGQDYEIVVGVPGNSDSSFGGITAEGGGNGGNGYCNANCGGNGGPGVSGAVDGYSHVTVIVPDYIPSGYVTSAAPECCAPPGVNGFVIISY